MASTVHQPIIYITENMIEQGNTIMTYIPPNPPLNSGKQRYIIDRLWFNVDEFIGRIGNILSTPFINNSLLSAEAAGNIEKVWHERRDSRICDNPYGVCAKRTCGKNHNYPYKLWIIFSYGIGKLLVNRSWNKMIIKMWRFGKVLVAYYCDGYYWD